MSTVLRVVLGVGAGLVLSWLGLVAVLLLVRPKGPVLREAVRLLPDTLGLLRRLASDPKLPRGVRLRLVLMFGYLAMPFDLIPDFLPIVGYADDAIFVALVLRSVVRTAGSDVVRRHWTGTEDGLSVLWRLAGLP
jgi:uncharacterized membrane protein YkvA (DUF1232 family)